MMCQNCGQSSCSGCRGGKCLPAKIAWIFLMIGGLNWGLVGLGGFLDRNWNVVNLILGGAPAIEWVIYLLVGVAAIVSVIPCRCKTCMPGAPVNE